MFESTELKQLSRNREYERKIGMLQYQVIMLRNFITSKFPDYLDMLKTKNATFCKVCNGGGIILMDSIICFICDGIGIGILE